MGMIEHKIYAQLDASGVAYQVIDCDPAYSDTALFCQHYGLAPEDSANTILVKAKTGAEKFVMCVVLATCKLDVNKAVRKRMGVRKASFAGAEETKTITGMEIGGVTCFAPPYGLPLWIDQRVMQRETIILGGGGRGTKLVLSPKIFDHTPTTEIVEDLAKLLES
jgi:prolyl-tRNA editing enzyme YbaK/EbsC (Cys-tRNA(Pro) deacylase)